ncbi:MAG: choice-of-anchor D domain-containing protein [Oligoflexia bacterium]|nr:choice-of-anchor D domain-containing protein [Oligoflexia bacterium]
MSTQMGTKPKPIPMMSRTLVAAGLGLALAACSAESGINRLYPDLVVAPDSLDFGGIVVPYDDAMDLQLINAGRATLTIDSITMASDASASGGVFTISPTAAELAPDDSVSVLVTFDPDTYLDYSTNLVINSDDPETPSLSVPVTAEGIDGPVPEIDLDTLALDFGEVAVGSSAQSILTITNTGTGPLEILPESAQETSTVFTMLSDPAGRTIDAGGSYPVIVSYAPTATSGDWSRYQVLSNDPINPQIDVIFLGNGGGGYNYPVAVIDADTNAAPLQTITFDGSGSYDPEGYEPLTYTWTLYDQPDGSSTSLSDTSATAPSMFLDAAGLYTLILQVDNTIGVQSDPAIHTVLATPTDNLYILLSWNTANSDVDLHLVRDDPDLYFVTPDDACYCNPNPDWGESGTADDPQLALDNRVGYGPENINIESPVDGNYYVKVHYFKDNGGGTTEATVKIYLSGDLVDTFSQTLTKNQLWDVATVALPTGLVTGDTTEPATSPYRTCQ